MRKKIIEKYAEDNGIYRSEQKKNENIKNALCLGIKSSRRKKGKPSKKCA
jgi:hypothetical protein